MSDEMELFQLRYGKGPDEVWAALKSTMATFDLREADDASRMARFSTGISTTSWGEHMVATVAGEGDGAVIHVRGRPKGSFLTTRIGERIHASGVRKDIERALRRDLGPAADG